MQIPINKDYAKEYRIGVWKGFTLHEVKYMVLGTAVSVVCGSILIFALGLHYQIAIPASVFLMFPVARMGFWESETGLNRMEYKKARKYRKSTAVLLNRAGECRPYEPEGWKPAEKRTKKELRAMKRRHRAFVRKQQKEK